MGFRPLMPATMVHDLQNQPQGLLRRLAHDRSGNTLALMAASLLPLLAMVGGGIDMGRSYLAQTRLQQACRDHRNGVARTVMRQPAQEGLRLVWLVVTRGFKHWRMEFQILNALHLATRSNGVAKMLG